VTSLLFVQFLDTVVFFCTEARFFTIVNRISLNTLDQKVTKFTVTVDESIYIFPANNLFQIKIKANKVSEVHTTFGVHRNVSKASTMSET
jgi:hypothetical protein